MSDTIYHQTVALLRTALENAYYEGVKGNRKPGDVDAIKVTLQLVDLATKAVREGD